MNDDDSPASILPTCSLNGCGVCLMSARDAAIRFQEPMEKNPGELGMYVLGPIEVPARYPHVRTHAPARDSQGRSVLLNGTLIQLGCKQLKLSTTAEIAVRDVQVVAITVWKSDHEEEMWTKALLTLDGYHDLVGKPWGRQYHDGGVSVAASMATSIQFHCEIQKGPRFLQLLKRSGYNKVWITPKGDGGKPDPQWKVLWLDGTPMQLEAKASTLMGSAGLVKGKKSLGLRIEALHFEAAWNRLKPGIPLSDHKETKHVFRIQPLPVGTDKDVLTEWGKQIGWSIRPIRAMGAKQWIVGSDSLPPPILTCNTQPILTQHVHQRGPVDTTTVVAGPKVKTVASWKTTRGSLPTTAMQDSRDLQSSIANAMAQQDHRTAQSFDELKQLFISSRGTKRTNAGATDDDEQDATM